MCPTNTHLVMPSSRGHVFTVTFLVMSCFILILRLCLVSGHFPSRSLSTFPLVWFLVSPSCVSSVSYCLPVCILTSFPVFSVRSFCTLCLCSSCDFCLFTCCTLDFSSRLYGYLYWTLNLYLPVSRASEAVLLCATVTHLSVPFWTEGNKAKGQSVLLAFI